MKYIKKFENTDYSEYVSDISDIKDILTSLKDDYSDISWEFYPLASISITKTKGITLKINTHLLLPKGYNEKFSIEYSNLKLDLIKKILEALERIEKAINKKCIIINIWDCGGDRSLQINIV
jgi:hypothetical protein